MRASDGAPTETPPIVRIGPFDIPGVASNRFVRVYVPNARPKRALGRILYLFDGQNVFDDGPSFAGGWHVHTIVERIRGKAPIVVGIEHGFSRRLDELSPFPDEKSLGLAAPFTDWIADHLAPLLHQQFGLDGAPERSFIGGSSMGGLAALFAHFRRPDRWGGALCMSPSFWFGRAAIFDRVASAGLPLQSRIYLDGGSREGAGMAPLVERMGQLLSARGYDADRMRVRIDRQGRHSEADWRRRLPSALRFLLR